ncbi:MAG: phage holin family protein [Caldilineaceae bacterium]
MATEQRVQNPTDDVAPQAVTSSNNNRSLGDLFNELSQDFSYLIRKEVELARTEVMENLNRAQRGIVLMVAAGLLGYAALIVLLVGLADLLYAWTGVFWLSALIIAVAVGVISAVLYFSGRSALSNVRLAPEQTIESLKDDAQWAKEQVQ